MPRSSKVGKKSQDRRPRPNTTTGRPRRGRPKVCVFCAERATWVDYKDIALLKRFTNDRGRIKARGATGTCAQHQRDVATAIKTARELALLPYSLRTMANDTRGPRGGDRRGGRGGPAAQDGETSGSSAEPNELSEDTDSDASDETVAATD
jgi:small subunit ribosomal protein S18